MDLKSKLMNYLRNLKSEGFPDLQNEELTSPVFIEHPEGLNPADSPRDPGPRLHNMSFTVMESDTESEESEKEQTGDSASEASEGSEDTASKKRKVG